MNTRVYIALGLMLAASANALETTTDLSRGVRIDAVVETVLGEKYFHLKNVQFVDGDITYGPQATPLLVYNYGAFTSRAPLDRSPANWSKAFTGVHVRCHVLMDANDPVPNNIKAQIITACVPLDGSGDVIAPQSYHAYLQKFGLMYGVGPHIDDRKINEFAQRKLKKWHAWGVRGAPSVPELSSSDEPSPFEGYDVDKW